MSDQSPHRFSPYWLSVLREHLARVGKSAEEQAARTAAAIPRLATGQRWTWYPSCPAVTVVAVDRGGSRTPWADVTCKFDSGLTVVVGASAFVGAAPNG